MRCQDKKAVRVCHSFGMDDSRSECPDMDMPTAEQCRCSKKKRKNKGGGREKGRGDIVMVRECGVL